ncbi:putative Transport protein Avl9 Stabilization of polarity axis [Trypanosoma vivax]|uniref:UDENN domain-containing protein n=1 Tax=Trypanosoma vivax (strain Y486) TaxID=1055687 RepID=G0U6V2_TRYVY|nr:putative Transport protein Avl9 Stabilization of polarity axis [Trypanosoma vivax]CCC51608.1 conserved hypothetical protein [Trypanosoma vivax Y486]
MSQTPWVACLASIRFDIDVGPVVEHVVPPNALDNEGKQALTHTAFPDCNPECGHDLVFFFLMKDCIIEAQRNGHSSTAPCNDLSSSVSVGREFPHVVETARNIYGATYYRQKSDEAVPRGYVQQAVVLLSRLPYFAVHELILRIVAPRLCQCCPLSPDTGKVPVLSALSPVPSTLFDVDLTFNPSRYSQEDVLVRAMGEIEKWPTPHPHVQYNLTLLGQSFTFVTVTRRLRALSGHLPGPPRRRVMQLDDRVTFLGPERQSLSEYEALPLYSLFREHLSYLTMIWELLLSHEPLFIWSNTPSTASGAALAVASLIEPIEFSGTIRAYLTVQDEAFARYSKMGKSEPFMPVENTIVGTTNPFFFRAFEGWKNRLSVFDRYARSSGSAKVVKKDSKSSPKSCNDLESVVTVEEESVNPDSSSDGGALSANVDTDMAGSPCVFTYDSFYPTLTAAKKRTLTRYTSPSRRSAERCSPFHQRGVSAFSSSFSFLVDHRTQTTLLLKRLEQASHLNAEAQLASLSAHSWDACARVDEIAGEGPVPGTTEKSDGRSSPKLAFCHSIADDIVRKFFVTLTQEFLTPVRSWFQTMTSELSVFHLCDPATLAALTPESFLYFLKENRTLVPSFLTRHPFKTYSAMYERFARGPLFSSFLLKLIDKGIRQGVEEMQVDTWAAEHPEEKERMDMYSALQRLVEREMTQSVDPDVVFVTSAISLLVGIAAHMSDPLRERLMAQISELKP